MKRYKIDLLPLGKVPSHGERIANLEDATLIMLKFVVGELKEAAYTYDEDEQEFIQSWHELFERGEPK